MKSFYIAAISGVVVWICAIMFFVFFGEFVLFSPGTNEFLTSTILLLIGTGLLLWGVTYIYAKIDQSENSPLRFGMMGTVIGLVFDSISLANYHSIFPNLDDTQVIAFTVWMSFAYALYLIIPSFINYLQKTKLNKK
ncbi:DUF5367 family protein [Ureibacillus sp. 179-F W5.1 NHS]|mgnify:CR=1 FL=1|uniref:DUF5367 family protein n=1 Tax=Ureibacillus sp. 179-F W5.1 NHS TaxID=3374297 RepID=UPI00387927F5